MTRTERSGRMASGFTLVELIVTLSMIGLVAATAIPRLRPTPARRVAHAAQQLLYNLDAARTSALATRKSVRVAFDVSKRSYARYLDEDGDRAIAESEPEMQAFRGRGKLTLPKRVSFGRGSAGPVPGDSGSGPITFADDRVNLDPRGVTVPFGSRGTIYLNHGADPEAVAAVTVSGSASLRVWRYRNGAWQ